jgi:hypothetical protein
VPVHVVSTVFMQALRHDEHLPLGDFAHHVHDGLAATRPDRGLGVLAVEP